VHFDIANILHRSEQRNTKSRSVLKSNEKSRFSKVALEMLDTSCLPHTDELRQSHSRSSRVGNKMLQKIACYFKAVLL